MSFAQANGSIENADVIRQKANLLLMPLRACIATTSLPPSFETDLVLNSPSFVLRLEEVFKALRTLLDAFLVNLQLDALSDRLQSQRLKTKDLTERPDSAGKIYTISILFL